MAQPETPRTTDQWLNGPIAESDNGGRGLGPTLGMDLSVEHEQEELARCQRERASRASSTNEQPGADTEGR